MIRRGARSRDEHGFDAVAVHVEDAKEAMLAAVPGPRREPAPLADALVGFEGAIRSARDAMPGWRRPEVEDVWNRCTRALDESARRAEWLRLEAPDLDFESLVLVLGDVIAPLDAFVEAEHRLRSLRRGQPS